MKESHNQESLPSLDAHAHLRSIHPVEELASAGAVLAMTLSLDEALRVIDRDDPMIAWGVGCYFSIHSAVARHSKFRTRVPAERVLVESDHGYNDPPEAIPCRIEWVEHLVAQQLKMNREVVRCLAWQNLARMVDQTDTWGLLPKSLMKMLQSTETPGS